MRNGFLIILICFLTENLYADSTSYSTYSHIHVSFLNTNHIINQEVLNPGYGYSVGFTKGYSYASGWGFETGATVYVSHFRSKYYPLAQWIDLRYPHFNYYPQMVTVYDQYTMMYLAVPLLAKYELKTKQGSRFFIRGGPQFEACFSAGYDMVGYNNPYVESGIFKQEYDYKKPCAISLVVGLGTDIRFTNKRYIRLEAQSQIGILSNTQEEILPISAGLSVSSPFRIKPADEIREKKRLKKERREENRQSAINQKKNAVYCEALGAGGLFSFNYERAFGYKKDSDIHWLFRAGIPLLELTPSPGLLVGLYGAMGGRNLKFEIGGGVAADMNRNEWEHLNIGIRYETKTDLLLRAGFTPIFSQFRLEIPFGGFSIGFRL